TVPSLRDALPLAMLVTALCAVPAYDLVLLMTNGGPGYATTTISFDAYGRAFGGIGQVGEGAALACLQGLVGLVLAAAALLVARGHERADGAIEAGAVRPARRRARWSAGLLGLVAAALTLAPLIWLLVLAVRPAQGLSVWATLQANLAAVGSQGFAGALWSSLALALAVAALALALAAPAAFALAMSRRRLLAVVAAVVLALGIFQPTAVLIIPLFYLLNSLALLNSPASVVLPQTARVLPMAVLLLWVGMRGLPAGVLEAAAVDGAAPRQVLRLIALPLLLPLVTVVGIWAFLSSWNDYLLPTVALQDESIQTIPMALAHFIGRFDTQYALLATGALLAVLPLLVLYAGLYGVMARGIRGLSWRAIPRG
ncbi:MAG TPA: ABC transporter permease subunit, partial [Chloroflexota bacterium]|nr:ABC transporter permease subunit [Chloroflexota bacterium]